MTKKQNEFTTSELEMMLPLGLVELRTTFGYSVYKVDKELVLIAKKETKLLMQRYKKEEITRDWKPNEEKTMFYGLLGEHIFKATLYELKIDHQYSEPMYPHELRRPHDFECKGKTIQVKTTQPTERYKNLTIKVEEWTGSDMAVAIKLVDRKLTKAHIIGYLTKEEVEALPIASYEYPCFYYPCYWCPLTEVTKKHPSYELFSLLKS